MQKNQIAAISFRFPLYVIIYFISCENTIAEVKDMGIGCFYSVKKMVFISLLVALFCSGLISADQSNQSIDNPLCGSLLSQADLSPLVIWTTDGPVCDMRGKYGTSGIYFDGYRDKPGGDMVGRVNTYLNYYSPDIAELYEFMINPDARRESAKNIWKNSDVTVETYDPLPGGVIVKYHDMGEWWCHYQIYFWKSKGVLGDVSVEFNKNLKIKKGIDYESLALSEVQRLAKLQWSRLPGGETGSSGPDSAGSVDLKLDAEGRLAIVKELYEQWNGKFNDYLTGNAQSYAGSEAEFAKPGKTAEALQAEAHDFKKNTMGLFKANAGLQLFESAASLITNTPQYIGYEAELWRRTREMMESKIAARDYVGAIEVHNEAVAAERKMNEGWFGKSGIHTDDEVTQPELKDDKTGVVVPKTETSKTGRTFSY